MSTEFWYKEFILEYKLIAKKISGSEHLNWIGSRFLLVTEGNLEIEISEGNNSHSLASLSVGEIIFLPKLENEAFTVKINSDKAKYTLFPFSKLKLIIQKDESHPIIQSLMNTCSSLDIKLSSIQELQSESLSSVVILKFRELFKENELKVKALKDENKEKQNKRRIEVDLEKNKLLSLLSKQEHSELNTDDVFVKSAFYLIESHGWEPKLAGVHMDQDPKKSLESIADASNLCIRKVVLKDQWWREDLGQFIVFSKQNKPFVAFRKSKGYYLWDAEKQIEVTLSQEILVSLSMECLYFYKRLEPKPLTVKDLIFFEIGSLKYEMILSLCITFIASIILSGIPLISAFVINSVLPSAKLSLLWVFTIALISLSLFKAFFDYCLELVTARMEFKSELSLTVALWDRILHFTPVALSKFGSGDLSSRMESCIGLQSFFKMCIQMGGHYLIQLSFSIALMCYFHPMLGLIGVGLGFTTFIATLFFGKLQMKALKEGGKSTGLVNSFTLEIFSGINKIKTSAAELMAWTKWAEKFSNVKRKNIRSQEVGHFQNGFKTLWSSISMACIYYFVLQLEQDELELGSLIAFITAYTTMQSNLAGVSSLMMGLAAQIPMISYVSPLLTNVPENTKDKLQASDVQGRLRAEAISFQYPGSSIPVLNNVQLEVPAGNFVALVGASGSGKSTLMKILCGLEKPSRGRVFLDDYNLESLHPRSLRENIASVQQHFQLLPGSLFENIKGATNASVEDVWHAAEQACIADEIRAMPMGLHTVIGGNANVFSGGQIQRIAIARALVRKAPVLMFDEATSALDNHVQSKIMKKLQESNVTILFIAHRLNAIKECDHLIVLHKGSVVQQGEYGALSETDGLFKTMLETSKGDLA